jgi:RimJ/RimL family protein N-acetyltransferase
MTVPFARRKKVQLIRGAAGRGLVPFLRQTVLCIADSGLRQKHLVFRISADKVRAMPFDPPPDMSFREVTSWDELSKGAQSRLSDPQEQIDWGDAGWFDRGWRLWVAESRAGLVALGWWRSAAQTQDFFCPLPATSEVLWHSTVMPEFQGKGLQVPLRVSLMRERVLGGVTEFYTNCRDYNTPSRRNILRMGFECIGACIVSKLTGQRRFRPLPPGKTL